MDLQFQSYYKQLGLYISYYRKLRNLTQMELAEFTDLSRTHISNIEAPNVKTSISLDTLFKIEEVLQVPPKVLLDFPVEEKLRQGRSLGAESVGTGRNGGGSRADGRCPDGTWSDGNRQTGTCPDGSRLDRNRSAGNRPGEAAVSGSLKCAHDHPAHKK